MIYFSGLEKNSTRIHMEPKRVIDDQAKEFILSKDNVGGIQIPNIKLYNKGIVIKSVWHKNR